jgi:hypothetical protein
MWYVTVTDDAGQIQRYEGLTRDQAAEIHKREYLNGLRVLSGKMS